MKNVKLFIAIDLSPVEKQALHCISHGLRTQCKEGRINSEEMYHITLHFFEEVPEDRVKDIQQAMKKATLGQKPFTMVTGKPGTFGTGESAVVWIGISDGLVELNALHDKLEKQLAAAGFLQDTRPYQPHITLGREIDINALHTPLKDAQLSSVSLSAHALTLLESKLVDGKPVYRTLTMANFEQSK
jgi:RNA 2',3'-cyclic 3'-phosphodiesterase